MKTLPRVELILASVLYPFIWYVGRERGIFPLLALLMVALWSARALMSATHGERRIAWIVALFFALVWLLDRPQSLYWYPVGMNLLMLILFAGSLLGEQSLIEKLARLQEPNLPPHAVAYTRKVTQIWCGFFIINGSIAAFLVLIEAWRAWAIYTGIIAYVLMGLLFAGEYGYRQWVKKLPSPLRDWNSCEAERGRGEGERK